MSNVELNEKDEIQEIFDNLANQISEVCDKSKQLVEDAKKN